MCKLFRHPFPSLLSTPRPKARPIKHTSRNPPVNSAGSWTSGGHSSLLCPRCLAPARHDLRPFCPVPLGCLCKICDVALRPSASKIRDVWLCTMRDILSLASHKKMPWVFDPRPYCVYGVAVHRLCKPARFPIWALRRTLLDIRLLGNRPCKQTASLIPYRCVPTAHVRCPGKQPSQDILRGSQPLLKVIHIPLTFVCDDICLYPQAFPTRTL
jgi:hypothetical protein